MLVLFATFAAAPSVAQDDPRDTGDRRASFLESHSPRGALWRAAAVPGWGQYYNRQYYKIPLVWAGLGGLGASAVIVNREYLLYRHAYHWIDREEVPYNVPDSYEQDYFSLLRKYELTPEDAASRERELSDLFRRGRDNLRRNRDLLYIGIGLFYGLTILDAYVNAHLLEFDVGEDLTVAVRPIPAGFSAALLLDR